MRLSLGLLLVGTVALVACSGDDGGTIHAPSRPGTPTPGVGPTGPGTGPTGPAAVKCPATVTEPTTLTTLDKTAKDLHIVAGRIIYQQGTAIIQTDKAGTGTRKQLYTSPDLVHSFADDINIVTVENPNAPDAILKVMPVGETTGEAPVILTVTPATPWNAGGTYVFASDQTSFYLVADVQNEGDTIFKVNRADPNQMTALAALNAPLSHPQLVGNDVWFVREQKRIYKVTMTPDGQDPTLPPAGGALDPGKDGTPGTATEIFGVGYADCNLAVGGNHAFCSTGTAVEQRDLTGGNVVTVFDSMKGATPSMLGAAMFGTDTLFVRSLPSSPNDGLKNGIRAVKGTDEKLVACGRDPINSFAADSVSIVWAEEGKGIFSAPR